VLKPATDRGKDDPRRLNRGAGSKVVVLGEPPLIHVRLLCYFSVRLSISSGSPAWVGINVDRRRDRIVLEFANRAAASGWSDASLNEFCAELGISGNERKARWPDGARSLGRELTKLADLRMLQRFRSIAEPSMAEILLSRFSQNAALKPAVASLAWSDVRHPIDTLARTRRTAHFMWRCYRRPRWSARLGRGVDAWLLTLAYSLCVMVWLVDPTPDARLTERTVRGSLRVIGLR